MTIETMAEELSRLKKLVEVGCEQPLGYQELLNMYGFYQQLKVNSEYMHQVGSIHESGNVDWDKV